MDDVRAERGIEDFWDAAVRLWTESGLSIREFCRREGLVNTLSMHGGAKYAAKISPQIAPASSPARAVKLPRWRRNDENGNGNPRSDKQQASAVAFAPVRVFAEEVSTLCAFAGNGAGARR